MAYPALPDMVYLCMPVPVQRTPEQLYLPLSHDEKSLRGYFERETGKTVSLTLTDNAVSMVSVRRKDRQICVRLHRAFLGADEGVLGEVGSFLRGRCTKTPRLRRFIKENISFPPETRKRRRVLRTTGRYHDLREIHDAVNAEYFGGAISCLITWGAGSPRPSARKRTLGSYCSHTGTIRINPVLDRRSVPHFFVEFVVYHEMLHAAMGVTEKNGRRLVHSGEFRQREKLFRLYAQALEWEKGNR